MDDDTQREQALLTALTTEHFVLQTARSATVAEAVGRATIFLSTVSAALIGLGFAAGSTRLVAPYLGAVLPTLLVIGGLTFVRLVETGVENMVNVIRIRKIRAYYHQRIAAGTDFFADASRATDSGTAARAITGTMLGAGLWPLLSTSAALIGALNSLLIGVGAVLLLGPLAGVDDAVSIAVGVVTAVASFGAHLRFISWSFDRSEAST